MEELRREQVQREEVGSEADIEDELNDSGILEESTVKIRSINKTENLFDMKNRPLIPDKLRSIVEQIE